MENQGIEKKRFLNSLWFAATFTIILFVVKAIESIFELDFSDYGLYPLDIKGLRGILLSPVIHGSWEHLINNSITLFILTLTLFYFYREVAPKVFFLIYFVHGFWLWFFGRHSFHIGASGIIYGLGAFLFVSGIIRKNTHLLSISLLVVFLYGSMVWGIFPLDEAISWEGHLTGMISGIIFAFYYKSYGPPPNYGIINSDELPDEDESYLEELQKKERKSD